jgi:signal transduction histidine kinase
VERAIQMTELVTQFSRLESITDAEPIELADLFSEMLEDRTRLERLGVALKVDVDKEIIVNMNRLHAHSLFTNIINNALDALEEVDDRSLTILAGNVPSGVRVEISDTGPGIPEDLMPKLFSPFFSTKPRKGTGLGLAICKRITDIYEGKISVDSGLDRGTTFTIFLKT